MIQASTTTADIMKAGLMEEIFSERTLQATGPFMALSFGILLLVLAEIVPGLQLLRKLIFIATLGVAGWCAWKTIGAPEAWVFEDTYVANSTTGWWTMLFLAATFIAWLFGQRYYKAESALEGEHDLLMMSACAGMVLMAGSRDLLVFFVGLELLSVPLYTLSAFQRSRRESVEAGLKYFVLGAFAAATYLFGSALVYAGTGTLTFKAINPADLGGPLVIAGAALIAASLFFKVSVFPFHMWVPDVYQGAPAPVTTFMATGTKAAAFAFLVPAAAALLPYESKHLAAVIALVTMAVGNFGALVQTDLKRLLAYSGVAHAGTLLLAIAALQGEPGPDAAMRAVLFYMAAYVFTAGGAFGLVTMLESQTGRAVTIDSIKGLAAKRPGIAAALALFMLSLGGIPATGGFLGKYLVFSLAVRSDLLVVALIGIVLSVVALAYYLRVIVALYMQPEMDGKPVPTQARALSGLVAFACAVMVLALGLVPAWFLDSLR
ncbi:MAG: NADH-quinone oxidoreductase subunit N [Planctomycetes bacterium]|nr:NADH-quinone oxidoreductase subunit N [Planctomycetota bacterium]